MLGKNNYNFLGADCISREHLRDYQYYGTLSYYRPVSKNTECLKWSKAIRLIEESAERLKIKKSNHW